jgi:hypothetical protein
MTSFAFNSYFKKNNLDIFLLEQKTKSSVSFVNYKKILGFEDSFFNLNYLFFYTSSF